MSIVNFVKGGPMPTPDRTSLAEIVDAGRSIVAESGIAGLTMQRVAASVGVRAPSLYKRVRSRDDLVRLVIEAEALELGRRLDPIAERADIDARTALSDLATTTRGYAHSRPVAFGLILAPPHAGEAPDRDVLARASAPLLRIAGELAGKEHALTAARTLTAWMNGFIMMELAGAFRLGGDLEQAWELGLAWIADAVDRRGASTERASGW
jgi:AcrR family transcriptional regulator